MPRARVTLADVAQRAGVSRTTASFVMTGRRDMRISAAAEERVLRAARELDYRPNLLARGLRDNLSRSIGLISDVVATEPFAGQVVRGAVATALLNGHLLYVGESEGDVELEKRLVRDMVDRGVGGILYASMYTRRITVSPVLTEQPLVLVNCIAGREFTAVVPDDRGAGRSAVRELLAAGHSDGIMLVGETPATVMAARDRRRGMDEELTAAGVALAGTVDCLWWPEPAYTAVRDLLGSGARPTAFICLNDRVAMGTYQAVQEAGLRIPDDISVVSFDDSDLASWLRPTLTSVALPHFELGRRGIELLLDKDRPAGTEVIEMPVIRRGSVAGPRTAPQRSS